MGRFDLRGIFALAIIGLVALWLLVVGGGIWVSWHIYQALALYLGQAS